MNKLTIKGIAKKFKQRKVVDEVSFQIESGQVVGLLGPNGAGKTTSFYMVVGLLPPDHGQILLNESEISSMPMFQRARIGLSYLPQEASVFRRLTVRENLLVGLEAAEVPPSEIEERLQKLLSDFNIQHIAESYGYALSGGERRRTEIARMLTLEPKFVLLDEPFAGIDPIAIDDIQQIIARLRSRGIGILITDHNVREALEITDRAYIISEGKLFRSGTPRELTDDPEVRRVYLGEKFRL